MERFEEAVPLYLKACEVEGKTDRTVQSYAETLRQFQRAGRELGLPEDVAAFGPAHVYLFMGWVRERRYSAPPPARGQGVLLLVPAHGLCRGEPVHAGADGEAGAEGRPAVCKRRRNDLASCL